MWPELFNYAANAQLRALVVLEEQAAAACYADHGLDGQRLVFAGCCHSAFVGAHDLTHPHYCPACFPRIRTRGCHVLFYVPAYPPLGGMLVL